MDQLSDFQWGQKYAQIRNEVSIEAYFANDVIHAQMFRFENGHLLLRTDNETKNVARVIYN